MKNNIIQSLDFETSMARKITTIREEVTKMQAPKRNADGDFLPIELAMKKINLCRANTVKLAQEAGALFKIGKAARVDWAKLRDHIDRNYRLDR